MTDTHNILAEMAKMTRNVDMVTLIASVGLSKRIVMRRGGSSTTEIGVQSMEFIS